MKPIVIYITGFRQHAGKTTTSLGLLSMLGKYFDPVDLAYIKPVGQEIVTLPDSHVVDKDALIIDKFSRIPDIDMKYVSPVCLGSGFTKNYLSSKDHGKETRILEKKILEAFRSLNHKKIIIAEGTGHPGVGGIVSLSNAQVSNLVGADVVFLSGGGIGKALDQLEVDLSYFLYKKCSVKGIIFNKLIPDKISQVKHYITEDLLNTKYSSFDRSISIFGFLPEIDDLYKPSMRVIKNRFKDSCVIGDSRNNNWTIPCNNIRIISLTALYLNPDKYLDSRDIVLIGAASEKRISRIIKHNQSMREGEGIGGLVLTCGETTPLNKNIEAKIKDSGIPAVYVREDTADTEHIINKCFENTKIQTYDEHKFSEIENLFEKHFDIEKFMDVFKIKA